MRSGEDASNDDNGHKLGEFHFDTRADAVLRAGGEAAISFTQDEEGEVKVLNLFSIHTNTNLCQIFKIRCNHNS